MVFKWLIKSVVAVVKVVATVAVAIIKTLTSARKEADKDFSDKKVGSTEEPCPEEKKDQKIVAVEILEGTKVAASGARQYVNLTEDAKWMDTKITHVDRLTEKLRVRVRFKEPGAEKYKIKIKPGGSNSVYTDAEKGRNAKYKVSPDTEQSFTTDANGKKTMEDKFSLAAAGGDKYSFEAKDEYGNTVTSSDVENYRRVYLQQLKMKTVPAAASIATLTGEYEGHKLEIVDLGSEEMDRIASIGTDTGPFKTKARTAYTAAACSNREPYVVAVAYTDHLAVKDANQTYTKANVQAGPGKADVTIQITNAAGDKWKYLWNNLVPGEGWFVSASFLKNGGTEADRVNIPEGKCTAVAQAGNADYYCKVTIRVSDLVAAVTTGTITLKVNTVNRMRGGLSFGGGNLICVCTRAWWADSSEAEQNQVMIHEMGHKIGMVPTGTDLDKTPKQYTGKGHIGSHCHAGVGVLADYGGSTASSTCVMFGATNGKSAFCADGAKAVKKQDLSTGWSAF